MPESLIDIICLIHDQAGWADLCIRSVEHHTKNPYRLILVDSASKLPETRKMLDAAENRGHTVIRLPENRSFSNGVNVGVNAGKSKFVCILNDDCIVTEGWEGALMQDASEKAVGLVGSRSNYAAGAQGDPTFIGEPPFLVFVCVAMRRQVWETVGPMDEETFDGFSSEDIDYSWRVRKAGYKLKVSNSYVLHAGSRTLAHTIGAFEKKPDGSIVSTLEGRAKNDQKYNDRLIHKWGEKHYIDNTRMQQRGLVVTYHAESWTRVDFLKNMIGLRRSDGVGFEYLQISRSPIQLARQIACDFATDNGFDWIVQLDDDATFPSDVLRKLLSHKKDVVCAIAYQRKPPHLPCIFKLGPDGLLGVPVEGIEHTGLREVDVSGFHCSIINTSVIKRLREGTKDADGKVLVPGIRQYFGGFDNKVGEDFAFCLNLKKIGIQMYCDTELISGHIGDAIIVDEHYKKSWIARELPHTLR